MNRLKKTILYIFIIMISIQFTGCYYGHSTKPKVNLQKVNVKFSEIMALSMEENGEKVYSLKDGDTSSSGTLSRVENISYNIQNKTWVYTKNINNGINLSNNYVIIYNGGKIYNINKSFSYSDVRLSSSSKYIALRSFKSDDIGSAEGLRVFSTNGGEKINFDKSVLVSGALYRWVSKDTLLYYGVEASQSGYGKIYGYDFQSSTRKIVFDKFNGYCTFFLALANGDILYVENDSNVYNMHYYDEKNDKVNIIGNNIEQVYDYVLDSKNDNIYMLGKDGNTSDVAIYRYNLITRKLDRLTYDFPNIIDKNAGIAADNLGNVYFCGMSDEKSITNDIYMYDTSNNSVNLITRTEENYHIISSGK